MAWEGLPAAMPTALGSARPTAACREEGEGWQVLHQDPQQPLGAVPLGAGVTFLRFPVTPHRSMAPYLWTRVGAETGLLGAHSGSCSRTFRGSHCPALTGAWSDTDSRCPALTSLLTPRASQFTEDKGPCARYASRLADGAESGRRGEGRSEPAWGPGSPPGSLLSTDDPGGAGRTPRRRAWWSAAFPVWELGEPSPARASVSSSGKREELPTEQAATPRPPSGDLLP